MDIHEQNAAMRAALDKIYHLRKIDWEPTRVCGIINQCIMAIGPASAAAPQVVADERAALALALEALTESRPKQDHYQEPMLRHAEAIKACVAALAAAPVQAQEPVAAFDMEVIDNFIGRITGSFGAAITSAYCPSSEPFKAARKRFYAACIELRNILSLSTSSAPVQPVAVPDGWRDAIAGLMDFAPTNEGPIPGMTRGGNWLRKDDVIEALSNFAAPAAQGDAISQQEIAEIINDHTDQGSQETDVYEAADAILAAIAARATS